MQSDAKTFQARFETGPFPCKGCQLFMPRLACNPVERLRAKIIAGDRLPFERLWEPHDVNSHRSAVVGDNAKLGALTLVMKGEHIPAASSWRGCPAAPAGV